jgi:hypothetical protein
MSQPAAPAATIVTTRFLNQFGRLSQRRQGNNTDLLLNAIGISRLPAALAPNNMNLAR